jgi:hypothetical protein
MSTETEQLREKIEALEAEVKALKRAKPGCGFRKRSTIFIGDMPLYDIALGADPEKGEARGHARGFIAIGDIATGVVAIGGLARGAIAVGGLAIGLFAFGGGAIGAIAVGGGAVGVVACGGGVVGYYACGGEAFGKHVLTALHRGPEAIRFFDRWIPGITQLVKPVGG